MKFSHAKIFPLVMKLGEYLKEGLDHYVNMKAAGIEPSAELLSSFILSKMNSWEPEVAGKKILDDPTRKACARFVGGIAYNLAKKEN